LASAAAGPVVNLTWTDNATNETGFVVERCTGAGCDAVPPGFAELATVRLRAGRGLVNFADSTVAVGGTYLYRVRAVNGTASSAYSNIVTAAVPDIPFAPATFDVALALNPVSGLYEATLTWTLGAGAPPATFTIQRSTNARFTTGLVTTNDVPGNSLSTTQTVNPNTYYYFRIRANNIGGISTWTNATPFPVRIAVP
jgi:hypothetical protein